jgi:hypothetical protein
LPLHRFWIEFDRVDQGSLPAGTALGCGVTAADRNEALEMIAQSIFDGTLPPLQRLVEDVDVTDLDSRHVRPNMGNPALRGIWYPLGYAS